MNRDQRQQRQFRFTLAAFRHAVYFLALAPGLALAEPGASGGHLPLLWAVSLAGAALCAYFPFGWGRSLTLWQTPARKWTAAVILAGLFLFFLSPLIIVLGSILITGRTM